MRNMAFYLHDVILPNAHEIVLTKHDEVNTEQTINSNWPDAQPTWTAHTSLNLDFFISDIDTMNKALGRLRNMPFLVIYSDDQQIYDDANVLLVVADNFEVSHDGGHPSQYGRLEISFKVVGIWQHTFAFNTTTTHYDTQWPETIDIAPVFGNGLIADFGSPFAEHHMDLKSNPQKIFYIDNDVDELTYDLKTFSENGYRIYDKNKELITDLRTIRSKIYLVLGQIKQRYCTIYEITKEQIRVGLVDNRQNLDFHFTLEFSNTLFPLNIIENSVFNVKLSTTDNDNLTWGLKAGPFLHYEPTGERTINFNGTKRERSNFIDILSDDGQVLFISWFFLPDEITESDFTVSDRFALYYDSPDVTSGIGPGLCRLKILGA